MLNKILITCRYEVHFIWWCKSLMRRSESVSERLELKCPCMWGQRGVTYNIEWKIYMLWHVDKLIYEGHTKLLPFSTMWNIENPHIGSNGWWWASSIDYKSGVWSSGSRLPISRSPAMIFWIYPLVFGRSC